MTGSVVHQLEGADGAFRAVVLESEADRANPPCAAVYGEPSDGCPVRVHSRCLYGEVFESTDCHCQGKSPWAFRNHMPALENHIAPEGSAAMS